MAQKKRIIFMGTPEFGAIILDQLASACKFNIAGVFTQPDKKSGRGLNTTFSEVKKLALNLNLPCFQPVSLKPAEILEQISDISPDFIVSAAYGIILPQRILDLAKIAPLNVHASILPKYRGAAPVARAIMENWGKDAKTGVSIMKMTAELDAGPVYDIIETPIAKKTKEELEKELAEKGGRLLLNVIDNILNKNLQPSAQKFEDASYAPKMQKADGIIDWHVPADEIDARIRAVTPWPSASAVFKLNTRSEPLEISIIAGRTAEKIENALPGQIFASGKSLKVACGEGCYEITRLKPHGRKVLEAADFINGQRLSQNGVCGMAKNDFNTSV